MKLKAEFLQDRYGFSSSPLREALNRLVQEGLIVADQRRGFRVAPVSPDDFNDITRVRLLIDPQALTESIAVGGEEWEVAVVSAFYRLEKHEASLSTGREVLSAQWSRLHKEFHMALIAASTSPRLLKSCSELFDQAERYRRLTARTRSESRAKTNEHKAIMDAALARDSQLAVALLSGHISRTHEHMMSVLESNELGILTDSR
jgi:DNA-binding GntR family transcriptional regulator